ncbi:MAG TPA: aminotransferase class I/II-fold pyridoxal phosphate-dependent enzyme [Candidatus Polarisedimenticolaceae bacterium]|nr:aminotransferase class I/II-fold pyridoxal phosphate-dependent enzyme [Candidatus Polarisedimenticolaceae bacterium]
MSDGRVMRSEYMEWAKANQIAPYTLAYSGIKGMSLGELGASLADLALDGPPGYGHPPLREALAATAGVGPERVVLATGTSGANHLVFATLVAPGDPIAMERPVYEPMENLARHLGADVRFFARRHENGFRVDPADVAAAMTPKTKAIVLSSLHNPSSAATDESTLRAIGEIAERVGAKVVVDEVYLDAAFEHAPPSAPTLGDVFLATTSLTKVFGLGGLRCGWIVAEPELAERMWRLKNLFGVNEAHPAERLAHVALRKRGAILARARSILDANRPLWHRFLDSRSDLDAPRLPFGTTSFPRVLGVGASALCEHLRARFATSLVPGRFFGADDHVRVGLGGDPATFPEGLDRLGRALDELRAGR